MDNALYYSGDPKWGYEREDAGEDTDRDTDESETG